MCCLTRWALRFTAALLAGSGCPAADAVAPGRLVTDPPTLENLGFRWYLEGDDNRNAAVTVSYRRKGEPRWREALPLLRVHRELVNRDYGPYQAGNLFAGSVLFLDPGATYEVRLVMTDPDGGGDTRTITATTRTEPTAYPRGRRLHVYPEGFQGQAAGGSFRGQIGRASCRERV